MQPSLLNVKKLLKQFVPTPANIWRLLAVTWATMLPIAVLCLLAACSTLETRPSLPANLADTCQDAPVFEGSTLGELVLYTGNLLEDYHVCRAKLQAVHDWSDRG